MGNIYTFVHHGNTSQRYYLDSYHQNSTCESSTYDWRSICELYHVVAFECASCLSLCNHAVWLEHRLLLVDLVFYMPDNSCTTKSTSSGSHRKGHIGSICSSSLAWMRCYPDDNCVCKGLGNGRRCLLQCSLLKHSLDLSACCTLAFVAWITLHSFVATVVQFLQDVIHCCCMGSRRGNIASQHDVHYSGDTTGASTRSTAHPTHYNA